MKTTKNIKRHSQRLCLAIAPRLFASAALSLCYLARKRVRKKIEWRIWKMEKYRVSLEYRLQAASLSTPAFRLKPVLQTLFHSLIAGR
jgi:hypothetical protein